MRGDNGASGIENLRNASVRDRSVGQTALRRLLSGLPPDSRLLSGLPPDSQIRDHQIRDPFLPAVFLLSETEEEFRSPLFLPGWSPLNGGVSAVPFSVDFC